MSFIFVPLTIILVLYDVSRFLETNGRLGTLPDACQLKLNYRTPNRMWMKGRITGRNQESPGDHWLEVLHRICGTAFSQMELCLDWFCRETRPANHKSCMRNCYPMDWEWSLVQAKCYLRTRLKIAWYVKMPLHRPSNGVAGSFLVMGSW